MTGAALKPGESIRDRLGWVDTRLHVSPCPYCGAPLNAATSRKGYTPSPGCFSVCVQCSQMLIFTEDLSLRAATPAELKAVEREHPRFALEVRIMQSAARAIDKRTEQDRVDEEEVRRRRPAIWIAGGGRAVRG